MYLDIKRILSEGGKRNSWYEERISHFIVTSVDNLEMKAAATADTKDVAVVVVVQGEVFWGKGQARVEIIILNPVLL